MLEAHSIIFDYNTRESAAVHTDNSNDFTQTERPTHPAHPAHRAHPAHPAHPAGSRSTETANFSQLTNPTHAILQDVSLSVSPGERVYLSAPSGTGKTTLCLLLAGYLKPWSGQILIDNHPLPRKGVCPVQLIGQHPERVLDPRRRMQDSLAEAGWTKPSNPSEDPFLQRLGIQAKWLTRFPHELSGGELQRFCIARALLANPKYLIADEISTMLDTITQARIWQVILEEAAARDLGIIFTTHSPALAERIATREICLAKTPAQL